MKKFLFLFLIAISCKSIEKEPTNSELFWDTLKSHCRKSYEGNITAGGKEGDGFTGEKLVIHVRSCEDDTIRIPFFVGEDKSRTWVFTISKDKLIGLKHDHRHEDGSEDEVTQYGGVNPNFGLPNTQFFPADQHTATMIPYASNNVWWIVIEDNKLTYNMRRLATGRYFSVEFDLTKELETPSAPWGSED